VNQPEAAYPSWLSAYQPLVPLPELVEEVNRIYHSFDAKNYDSATVEIERSWPALWKEMVAMLPPRNGWRVLDFGCGTGFEAGQVLRLLGERVASLLAYDPSEKMLAQARNKIGDSRVKFSAKEADIALNGPYDLLITNSVLHHLPQGAQVISRLDPQLTPDAYWLAGNEPSKRFYQNIECRQVSSRYAEYQQRRKWISQSRYLGWLKGKLKTDSYHKTAKASRERGLFVLTPDWKAISRLVDFHVQHSPEDSRGFDLGQLKSDLKPHWTLLWSKTYSFLGTHAEIKAPKQWRAVADDLRRKFPHDGANFCAVWARPDSAY